MLEAIRKLTVDAVIPYSPYSFEDDQRPIGFFPQKRKILDLLEKQPQLVSPLTI